MREHAPAQANRPKAAPKAQAGAIVRKQTELQQLRGLMKAGTLSQAVGNAAIAKADEELATLHRTKPAQEEKEATRVVRMLPRAVEIMRKRNGAGGLGLRDPRSILQARSTLFEMFGGNEAVRSADVKVGEKPYLIARVGLNREVLLKAAGSCLPFLMDG